MHDLGLIGLGNMGRALTDGFLANGALTPPQLAVFTRTEEKAQDYAATTGCTAVASLAELVNSSSALLAAVKPYQMHEALSAALDGVTESKLVISVAAGVTCDTLSASAGANHRIVRVMPNTPSLIGAGASSITAGPNATEDDLAFVEKLFSSVGICVTVPEDKIHAVIGVSGSAPAYVYTFIEALADGGVVQGLSRADSLKLAAQTVLGAARMVQESGDHPAVLRDAVASPGGTTIAAIHSLEQSGLRAAVIDAAAAAANRSREMSRPSN
ncbi:pyrroline-5-carboxylate reductase [Sulfuriroseicoccus oceanibius]|uniref:Pyrroline-5-carboxylate reductase n=1 Tax=Sulfuriroseicoccus oceanibius TaxID=2707525 RepID=A0A6B3L8U8_9BACT|nr:pyrroline-5-carboxylate reductase [Sulfuriroseicoccus oceanibius]QQL43894.1 pyrroline-5-carboxylate reductase [Sulfuriroseicoccus oceanibius]